LNFEGIKNLIFDLGGVIINIDINITINAFANYYGASVPQINEFLAKKGLWELHEVGSLSDEILRSELNSYFINSNNANAKYMSTTEFEMVWNSLLLNIPQERIDLLKALAIKYRLFLLSNTNHTHILDVNAKLARENNIVGGLESLFEKVYYSYNLGMRKPDPKIYEYVLKDKALSASESVFIDDNEPNIISSGSVGIHTILVKPPHTILELLAKA